MKICRENPNFVKIEQKPRTLYQKTTMSCCCPWHKMSVKSILDSCMHGNNVKGKQHCVGTATVVTRMCQNVNLYVHRLLHDMIDESRDVPVSAVVEPEQLKSDTSQDTSIDQQICCSGRTFTMIRVSATRRRILKVPVTKGMSLVTTRGYRLQFRRPYSCLEDRKTFGAKCSRYHYNSYSYFYRKCFVTVGRVSSVGIATCYGLDGPGIEFKWGEIFRTRPYRSWGPYRLYFPGVKKLGRRVDYPPPSGAEVKERVELYICSSSGRS